MAKRKDFLYHLCGQTRVQRNNIQTYSGQRINGIREGELTTASEESTSLSFCCLLLYKLTSTPALFAAAGLTYE